MEIKQGRRKSFDIEFALVTENNLQDVATWSRGVVGGKGRDRFVRLDDKGAQNPLQKKAFIGDFIVHHLELDTFKKFSRKAFNASYEETEERQLDRSSETGQFVSHEEAVANPSETVTETVEVRTSAEQKADEVPGVAYMHPSNTELPRDADPS